MKNSSKSNQKKLEYLEIEPPYLDLIKHLWEQLNEHHKSKSRNFAEYYTQRVFENRKSDLIQKCKSGIMHLDAVKNSENGQYIGYCVSTINNHQGEVDSIYIAPAFRRSGVGDTLLQRALKWMDENSVNRKVLVVAAGNEEVFAFYSRYNFFPKRIILEQTTKCN